MLARAIACILARMRRRIRASISSLFSSHYPVSKVSTCEKRECGRTLQDTGPTLNHVSKRRLLSEQKLKA